MAGRAGLALLSMAGLYGAGAMAAQTPVKEAPQVAPPAPGFAPFYTQAHDQTEYAVLARNFESLFGRISTKLGPTNPRWSTFTGEMKPEDILAAMDKANLGYPFVLCDMMRRAVENDAHLAGTVWSTFSPIVAKKDSIDPPATLARDPLAISVANWLRAVREQVKDFDGARFALLWAEGQGYAAAENIYGMRRVVWFTADGRRVCGEYCVPIKLEIVEGRSFQFDIDTDEPRLWLQGDYVTLPPAKFIFHVAHGVTQIRERRGFMRSCLVLHAIKQWCIRDLAVYLHLYGIPQVLMQYDQTKVQYEKAKEIAAQIAQNLGQGGVGIVPSTHVNLISDMPPVNGALVHSEAGSWLNTEMTKAVTGGGPLTMESTGGGYNLGMTHAEGAYNTAVLRARNLCDSIREQLWSPTLQLNKYRLASELGEKPEDIVAVLPAYVPQIDREVDAEKRQKIFSQAMVDGCPVSLTQYRAAMQLDAPKDEEDKLLGKGTPIPSSGAVVSAVDASEGVVAPMPNAQGEQETPELKKAADAEDGEPGKPAKD